MDIREDVSRKDNLAQKASNKQDYSEATQPCYNTIGIAKGEIGVRGAALCPPSRISFAFCTDLMVG